MAGAMKRESLVPLLKAALDKLPAAAAPPGYAVSPTVLPKYVGTYRDAASGLTMTVTLDNGTLMFQLPGQPAVRLVPSAENVFRIAEVNATLTFNERGGLVESVGLVQGPANLRFARVTAEAAAAATAPTSAPAASIGSRRCGASSDRAAQLACVPRRRRRPAMATASARSPNGTSPRGKNIKWKTPIPGVATSSPIVWGNRVFATTAISKAGDNSFRTGLYGDVKPVDDCPRTSGRSTASTRRPERSCGSARLPPPRQRPSDTPRAVRRARRR